MTRLLLAWLFLNSFPLLLVSSRSRPSTYSVRARGVRSLTHQRPLRSLGHTAKCRRFVFAPACRGIMSKRGNIIGHASPNQMMENQPMIPWERFDESYSDNLDNSEVEDNNDVKDALEEEPMLLRFPREIEYGLTQKEDHPTIIALKLPKKVRSFKVYFTRVIMCSYFPFREPYIPPPQTQCQIGLI